MKVRPAEHLAGRSSSMPKESETSSLETTSRMRCRLNQKSWSYLVTYQAGLAQIGLRHLYWVSNVSKVALAASKLDVTAHQCSCLFLRYPSFATTRPHLIPLDSQDCKSQTQAEQCLQQAIPAGHKFLWGDLKRIHSNQCVSCSHWQN